MKIDIGQLEFINKTLRDILVSVEVHTGLEFTITSLYRIGDNGNHGQLPLRATDLRMRCADVGKEVEKHINSVWMYDFKRPHMKCAVLHGSGFDLHLHIQVHPNTRLYETN